MEKVKSSDQRALRRAHVDQYKPRALPLHRAVVVPRDDPLLRRLVTKALDELKRPDAIPSRILMSVLTEARELGAN